MTTESLGVAVLLDQCSGRATPPQYLMHKNCETDWWDVFQAIPRHGEQVMLSVYCFVLPDDRPAYRRGEYKRFYCCIPWADTVFRYTPRTNPLHGLREANIGFFPEIGEGIQSRDRTRAL